MLAKNSYSLHQPETYHEIEIAVIFLEV